MKVFFDFSEAQGNIDNAVVTIGMFDGVHAGHKTVINHVKQIAEEIGGESTVVTFWPHPRQVLSNDAANLKLINTLEEKIDLLGQTGLQNLIVHPFTIEFSKTSSDYFLQNYIAKTLRAKAIVVGKNHYFGHNREGNFSVIEEFAKNFSIFAHQIPLELINQETISSAKIREALASGNIQKSNELLQYEFFITGSLLAFYKDKNFMFVLEHPEKLLPVAGTYHSIFIQEETELACTVKIFSTKGKPEKISVLPLSPEKPKLGVKSKLVFVS